MLIFQVVMSFSTHSAKAIEKAQEHFGDKNIKNNLQYIKAHFKMLSENITKLETFGLPLTESHKIMNKVEMALQSTPGTVGKLAYEKFKAIKSKNPRAKKIQDFAKFLNGEERDVNDDYCNVDWSIYKFCPKITKFQKN